MSSLGIVTGVIGGGLPLKRVERRSMETLPTGIPKVHTEVAEIKFPTLSRPTLIPAVNGSKVVLIDMQNSVPSGREIEGLNLLRRGLQPPKVLVLFNAGNASDVLQEHGLDQDGSTICPANQDPAEVANAVLQSRKQSSFQS